MDPATSAAIVHSDEVPDCLTNAWRSQGIEQIVWQVEVVLIRHAHSNKLHTRRSLSITRLLDARS